MDFVLSILHNPPWDFVLFFLMVTFGFFVGMTDGKKKITIMMLGIYVLLAIFPHIPIGGFVSGFAPQKVWIFQVAIFLVLLFLVTLLLLRLLKYTSLQNDGVWWKIMLMSLLGASFLSIALLNLAPIELFEDNIILLSPIIKTFFLDSSIAKWWIILPIFGILFF